jgi:hypothetical protein
LVGRLAAGSVGLQQQALDFVDWQTLSPEFAGVAEQRGVSLTVWDFGR